MKLLVRLRDTPNSRVEVISLEPEQTGYMFRYWEYPVGVKVSIVHEIKLEEHEMVELLSTLIDEIATFAERGTLQ